MVSLFPLATLLMTRARCRQTPRLRSPGLIKHSITHFNLSKACHRHSAHDQKRRRAVNGREVTRAQSMPSLTIKPPRRPSQPSTTSQPRPQDFTHSVPPRNSDQTDARSTSPVAPAFSPITPKAQPAALYPSNGAENVVPPGADEPTVHSDTPIAPVAEYIPQPPPRPFSDENSTDAIALRAAISALQFQKKKARGDLKTLEKLKRQAVDEPEHFKRELAAGRLQERRPKFGGFEAVLDDNEDDDDDDDDEDHTTGIDEAMKVEGMDWEGSTRAEIPDSQSSALHTSFTHAAPMQIDKPANFSKIPGAQAVARMPHINWEKYQINGDALDAIHEQQRRWPGNFAYGTDRGREFSVVAPFSPFLDQLEGQSGVEASGSRKDSAATTTALGTPTGVANEHPMETRRSSKYHQ